MMADLHLPLKPRSDLALLNGIAHILIRHNMIDRAYIERHTTGFDELERFLEAYPPDRVAEITGLSEEVAFQDGASCMAAPKRDSSAGPWA